MKTALTVWDDRISPVFDSASRLLVAEIEDKRVTSKCYEPFDSGLSPRLTERLAELDVEVLICGAISEQPAKLIEATGIKLIPFIAGSAEEVLNAYAKGMAIIPAFLMPGCGRKRHRHVKGKAGRRQMACSPCREEVIGMPKGDGTGPKGKGTGTGKGKGGCNPGQGGGSGSGQKPGQGKGCGGGGQGQGKGGGRQGK